MELEGMLLMIQAPILNLSCPPDATRDVRSERSAGTRLHTHPGTQLDECAVQVCKDRACVSRRRQNAHKA